MDESDHTRSVRQCNHLGGMSNEPRRLLDRDGRYRQHRELEMPKSRIFPYDWSP